MTARPDVERLALIAKVARGDQAEYQFTPDEIEAVCAYILSLEARNRELEEGLRECAAEFRSEPGNIMSCAAEVGVEFQRRMDIAARALVPDPKAGA